MEGSMNPYCALPGLGSSFQQARAVRPESDNHLTDIGLDRSQIVSAVEEIIETGDRPA